MINKFYNGENNKSADYIDKLNKMVKVANNIENMKVHGDASLAKTPNAYIINVKQAKKTTKVSTTTFDFIYPTENLELFYTGENADHYYPLTKEAHERKWLYINNAGVYPNGYGVGYGARLLLPANPSLEDTYCIACYHRNQEVGIVPNINQIIKMPVGNCYGIYYEDTPHVDPYYVRINEDFYASSLTTIILTCCDATGGGRGNEDPNDTNNSAIWIPVLMECCRIKPFYDGWAG